MRSVLKWQNLRSYVPKAERVSVVKTVEKYGTLSFKGHKNRRRGHIQQSYKNHFKTHISPKFGKRLVSSITSMQLLGWQNEKLEQYESSTVRKFRSIFYTILDDAVIEGIIEVNPFNRVPRPLVIEEYNEDDDLDELHSLLSKSTGYKHNFIGIMAFSGARPGELVALKWSDVDFKSESFKIVRT